MGTINIPALPLLPDWEKTEKYKLAHHLWAEEYPAFYNTCVQLCAVSGKGLFVRFFSEEPSPVAVYTRRDDPVYNDSCMEVFIQPFRDDTRYVNIEINPNGAYLGEIGTCRADRRLIKSVSDTPCTTTVLESEKGWGVELFIPDLLICECFGRDFSFIETKQIKINVYKCGEKAAQPHYSSLFHVGTATPDYHRPEFFGAVNITDERELES